MYKKTGLVGLITIAIATSFYLISMGRTDEGHAKDSAAQTPLAIHLFPENQQIKAGEPVSWYLTAAGKEPLQYQWKLNGQDILGATHNTLKISSVKPKDQGTYVCSVKNQFGAVETDPVKLTVMSGDGIATS